MTNNILAFSLPIVRPFSFIRLKTKTVCILGACFCVSLIGLYIFQINALTVSSFQVNSYQKQLTALSKESKNLESNYSGLSSLANLEGLAGTSAYEKVGKVYYIQMVENTMAKK